MTPHSPLAPADFSALLEVARYLGQESDLDRLLARIIDSARQLLRAERATVFLHDPDWGELYCRLGTGVSDIRIPADQGIAGRCAQSQTTVRVADCQADPRFDASTDRATGYTTRNLLAVPLHGIDQELVGVLEVLNKEAGPFTEHDEAIAWALAGQCAVALQRTHLLADRLRKEKLERDLALARQIQLDLLPRAMPDLAGYDLAGWTRPADQTGGDLYDAGAVGSGRALLLLCDATGHGIGPALSVSQVRTMFRLATRLQVPLTESFEPVNEQLVADLADERFVTAFVGELDATRHRLQYRSAGQAPLLHISGETGACQRLSASSLPFGIVAGLDDPEPSAIELGPGDVVALISDGIFEQPGPNGEQFGTDRVEALIAEHRDRPMAEVIELVREAVEAFSGDVEQHDDMTMLLVRRLPAEA